MELHVIYRKSQSGKVMRNNETSKCCEHRLKKNNTQQNMNKPNPTMSGFFFKWGFYNLHKFIM